jgi:hypothetical protein
MPKPSDYTPARRYVMQGVMMLILGASVALAAAVASSARRANRVELSPESVTRRDVTVRLPQGWEVRKDSKDPAVVVEAVEVATSEDDDPDAARTVAVRLERLPAPASTLQYLVNNYELPEADADGEGRGDGMLVDWLTPIPIAGRDGMMMTAERGSRPRRRGRRSTLRKEVIATVVLPSLRAVVVHLEGAGKADANDHAVVKQIAAAITVGNEPELGKPGEVVTLVDGIRFAAPRAFAPVPEPDTSRTDRRLWPAVTAGKTPGEIENRWQSIEVVGCLCPDFDAGDPKQAERARSTLATLLLVRDPRLRDATVTSVGNKVWRAEPPQAAEGGDVLRARAYLMTDPSGRALLAVIYGGLGRTDFDATWKDLAASVRFLPAADVATLEDVGTTEAARLRRSGYETLLADRDVQWWLWTRDDAYIGWSSTDFTARQLVGKKESRVRLDHGQRVSRVVHDFSYSDAGPRYESTVLREQSSPGERLQSTQQTTVIDGRLSTSYKQATGATTQLSAGDPPPPQFVPGALLPLVLGQLAREPMLLMTDSFPSREGIGPPQLLTLIIRPGDNTTRTAEGEATPMRCVTVQVNGVGALSRWYFRQSGELEIIEWPGGIRESVSDEKSVKNYFPKGDPLAP